MMYSAPQVSVRPVKLIRWARDAREEVEDMLAVEEPLEIRIAERSLAVVMRTPGNDRELVAGFLVTEGIVADRSDLLDLVHCDPDGEDEARPNVMIVHLAPRVRIDWARLARHTFASSSCGLCGKASIEAVRTVAPPLAAGAVPARAVLESLPRVLREHQQGFSLTGGVHASGIFGTDGSLVAMREDVGRHNALDKVIGWALLAGHLPLSHCMLLVSGRVSFEIMQKALMAGIPSIAAVSAPTSLAVEFARESGQTLVGFVRGDRMNVYAGTIQG